jgi:hypothetical protein
MFDFGFTQLPGLLQSGEKLVGYWKKFRQRPEPETLATRFVRLFEAHGVKRNQIPRFFGHGLQLKDVQSDAELIKCLSDEHLADASQLFGVERQWLESGEGRAHTLGTYYGQPAGFGAYLDKVLSDREGLSGVELSAALFGAYANRNSPSILVLSVPIGELNDQVIYRYTHIDVGPLGYWKVRVNAAVMVAQAWRRNVWLNGRNCDEKLLEQLLHKEDLTTLTELERLTNSSRRVEVEDWLLVPEAFLEGVDPENGQFGARSALEKWLRFDADGHMQIDVGRVDTRQKFEEALAGVSLSETENR